METYRLKSKLVENDREFVIQTVNDATLGAISSEVFVNGQLAETVSHPHPMEIKAEEVLSLLKVTHGEKKKEIETLLAAYRSILSEGDPEMLRHLGTALFYKGFYGEARDVFAAATDLAAGDHASRNLLGLCDLALGHIEEAIEAASLAVEKRPGYADYRNNYGEALLAGGEITRAIDQFNEAVRINMYYGDAYLNLGLAHLRNAVDESTTDREQVNRAADCFRRAAVIHADYDAGNYDRAMQAIMTGDLEAARKAMLAIKNHRRDCHRREFAAFYMRFIMHPEWVSERTVEERIRYLERAIRRNPQYVDLYSELGRCYLEQARLFWHKGVRQYQHAVELNPSLSDASAKLDDARRRYEDMCASLETMGLKG